MRQRVSALQTDSPSESMLIKPSDCSGNGLAISVIICSVPKARLARAVVVGQSALTQGPLCDCVLERKLMQAAVDFKGVIMAHGSAVTGACDIGKSWVSFPFSSTSLSVTVLLVWHSNPGAVNLYTRRSSILLSIPP